MSNKSGTFTGSIDVPLSQLGEKQAEKVCEFLLDKDIDAIYSSPLSRAKATVFRLAEKLRKSVVVDDRFCEIYFGSWEGKEKEYLLKNVPQFALWRSNPLNSFALDGENPISAGQRFLQGLSEVVSKHEGETIVISSHGAIILSLMSAIGYFDIDKVSATNIAKNASVTKLVYDKEYTVEFYGYEDYLQELKADFRYV